jgi:hypothetical protein
VFYDHINDVSFATKNKPGRVSEDETTSSDDSRAISNSESKYYAHQESANNSSDSFLST